MFGLNEQETLELILSYINNTPNGFEGFAGRALVYYIVTNFPELKSAEDIQQKCVELISGYVIKELHSKDIIDVSIDENGEEIISLTKKGRSEI